MNALTIFKRRNDANAPSEAAYIAATLMLTELVKAQEQVNNPLLLKGGAR